MCSVAVKKVDEVISGSAITEKKSYLSLIVVFLMIKLPIAILSDYIRPCLDVFSFKARL